MIDIVKMQRRALALSRDYAGNLLLLEEINKIFTYIHESNINVQHYAKRGEK